MSPTGKLWGSWLLQDDDLVEKAYRGMLQGRLEQPDGAIESFRDAVRRDPASPYRWCDLGEALLATWRSPMQAGPYFKKAVALGPNAPAVLLRAANWAFRSGQTESGLAYTKKILKITPDYDGVVFENHRRFEISNSRVINTGLPEDRRAASSYLAYLSRQKNTQDIKDLWNWACSKKLVDTELANRFIACLINRKEYGSAGEMWRLHTASIEPACANSEFLFNGGFEREPVGSAFDWNVRAAEGFVAGRDSTEAAQGASSLRITFDGTRNLSFAHVFEKAVLGPGEYVFRAYVRTGGLTTDQGVRFRIRDCDVPRRIDVVTPAVKQTNGWERFESRFAIAGGIALIQVQLSRDPSLKFDNKIAGRVWIDGISIVRVLGSEVAGLGAASPSRGSQ